MVLQTPRVIANRAVEITSMLAHSSGEFMAFDISFPAWQDTKDGQRFDAQTIGSAITYGRRYSYQSLLNISAEEDDDGNATVRRNGHAEAKANGNGNGYDSPKPNGKAKPEPVAVPSVEEPRITQTEQNAFCERLQEERQEASRSPAYSTLGVTNSDEIEKGFFRRHSLGTGGRLKLHQIPIEAATSKPSSPKTMASSPRRSSSASLPSFITARTRSKPAP